MEVESKILIAAISASSAILGAVVSQIVTVVRDLLEKKHQRNVLLRNKYEELAGFITESQEWSSSLLMSSSLKELRNKPPIYARKALVLSYIYFPLLRDGCEEYIENCIAFQIVLIDNHEFKDNIDCGIQAVHKNGDAVLSLSSKLQNSRQNLDDLIIQYASKYAKS